MSMLLLLLLLLLPVACHPHPLLPPPPPPPPVVAAGNSSSCEGVFFVHFLGDQLMRFALSRDGLHWMPLLNNTPVPGFDGPGQNKTIRDPFVRFDPASGLYRMVATDGWRFGHDALIWYWESPDLVNWSEQRALHVMDKYVGQFQDTWAPEWVWDHLAQEYVVFWTTRWLPNATVPGRFSPGCTNKNRNRFTQWHTRTKDWKSFAAPTLFIDMHCMLEDFAPMQLGDGGYDADVQFHAADGLYRAYFKSMQAPSERVGSAPWNDQNIQPWSGVHVVSSPDLKTWSPPLPATHNMDPEMIGMWGAEGPEILVVNDTTMHLYFDCSFQPFDKSKWPKPPYGVATAPFPAGYTDVGAWKTIPGSCTGNNTANVDFPTGATQGSFICISNEQYAAIERKWPP
jgi:hypothetical protein